MTCMIQNRVCWTEVQQLEALTESLKNPALQAVQDEDPVTFAKEPSGQGRQQDCPCALVMVSWAHLAQED